MSAPAVAVQPASAASLEARRATLLRHRQNAVALEEFYRRRMQQQGETVAMIDAELEQIDEGLTT